MLLISKQIQQVPLSDQVLRALEQSKKLNFPIEAMPGANGRHLSTTIDLPKQVVEFTFE